ncbi:MAG: tRNA(Ile)-lysidine synthetase [Frankiales bacterium]|nr:tRNA(Ile)-lysidine synthetase [Frankiales bacterium]
MTGPPAATAAVRVAVRRCLADVDAPVAAAVSGGADSLALAAALAFERPGSFAFVVDHGIQQGSAAVAERAAEQCRGLGLVPRVLPVQVRGSDEAAAREARYAALSSAGAGLVLLGHTLDDQAETVLLGLARGSGARALSGMAAHRGIFRRPLLGISREVAAKACAEAGLVPWADPHNEDPRFSRVRVRSQVMPVMEAELGPGIAAALARSAAQLRDDADALDALTPVLGDEPGVGEVLALPPALRSRALKAWAERLCGRPVTAVHVDALRALVEDWSGQGPADLPGGARIRRTEDRLSLYGG